MPYTLKELEDDTTRTLKEFGILYLILLIFTSINFAIFPHVQNDEIVTLCNLSKLNNTTILSATYKDIQFVEIFRTECEKCSANNNLCKFKILDNKMIFIEINHDTIKTHKFNKTTYQISLTLFFLTIIISGLGITCALASISYIVCSNNITSSTPNDL